MEQENGILKRLVSELQEQNSKQAIDLIKARYVFVY